MEPNSGSGPASRAQIIDTNLRVKDGSGGQWVNGSGFGCCYRSGILLVASEAEAEVQVEMEAQAQVEVEVEVEVEVMTWGVMMMLIEGGPWPRPNFISSCKTMRSFRSGFVEDNMRVPGRPSYPPNLLHYAFVSNAIKH